MDIILTQQENNAKEIGKCVYETFRPRQKGRHFADEIFICIFLNDSV